MMTLPRIERLQRIADGCNALPAPISRSPGSAVLRAAARLMANRHNVHGDRCSAGEEQEGCCRNQVVVIPVRPPAVPAASLDLGSQSAPQRHRPPLPRLDDLASDTYLGGLPGTPYWKKGADHKNRRGAPHCPEQRLPSHLRTPC